MSILDELAAYSRVRVESDKKKMSIEEARERCKDVKRKKHVFMEALRKPHLSFICEIKKASPSKGIISRDFPYLEIARQYDEAGADCISCLTEPKWFMGSDEILKEVRRVTDIPMIRKDFTVDEYQLYQAGMLGADAALLICAILDKAELEKYIAVCDELGMDALVEAHNEDEIKTAVAAGAKIIGVNNRNLRDFSVDVSNSERLRSAIPSSCVYVAESGMKSADDIAAIAKAGADAVLIGETFMRSSDKAGTLRLFRDAAKPRRVGEREGA